MLRLSTATWLLGCIMITANHLHARTTPTSLDSLLMPYIEPEGPGFAVGIVKNGEIVYERYAGLANLEHDISVDSLTRFNIASNAKQYTALMVLQLVNEKVISRDDDFREYLIEYFPDYPDPITISHLLTHTSGIRDVYDLWELQGKTWWKLFVDNEDALALLRDQRELNFKPGSQYLYSNSNYILLAALIEKVTGTSFHNYAGSTFRDMGMPHTNFLANHMEVVPNRARPYGNWDGWIEYPSITSIHGDGALFTTLPDQLRWEATLQRKDNIKLDTALIKESQGKLPVSMGYGYGVMHDEYRSIKRLYHDGNTGAYNATFLRFPEEKLAVVVMSNNGNVPTHFLAESITDRLLGLKNVVATYPAGPVKTKRLKNISEATGRYKTSSGSIIHIVEKEGVLYRELYQAEPVKLINEKGNLFYYETNPDLKIAFTVNKEAQKEFTIYLSSQAPIHAIRLPDFSPDQSYYSALNGRYINEETGTEILIRHIDEAIYSINKNDIDREGVMLTKDYLRMNSYEITVDRNDRGGIEGLLVNNGRVQNVRFSRQ
ncbi:serine hydrolase domain-containing protein [Roseivirga sp. BDSF3-8]|uniref:serine hydrolase domain-containing protein n=1 Tax=Roseivirga sp. BDSF3-8 TaxID=3241598 RepID=UPI0035324B03